MIKQYDLSIKGLAQDNKMLYNVEWVFHGGQLTFGNCPTMQSNVRFSNVAYTRRPVPLGDLFSFSCSFLLCLSHYIIVSGIILKYAAIFFAFSLSISFTRPATNLYYWLYCRRLSTIFYPIPSIKHKTKPPKRACWFWV